MNLTEQDKSDLMGLISGFGTPQSDKRAHHLVEVRPEAADYIRQMKTIAKVFSLPRTEGTRTPQRDVLSIAADIRAKAAYREKDRAGSGQSRRRWHPAWKGVAAAAVFLALCTTWVALRTRALSARHPTHAVLISYAYLFDDAASDQIRTSLAAGDRVQPKKELAVIIFADGARGIIQQSSDIVLGQEDQTVILNAGEVFACAPHEMHVLTGDAVTELRAAKAHLKASEQRLTCTVYEGTVLITIQNQTYKVLAGHSAVWSTMDNAVHIQPSKDAIPAWAVKGLDIPVDPITGQGGS